MSRYAHRCLAVAVAALFVGSMTLDAQRRGGGGGSRDVRSSARTSVNSGGGNVNRSANANRNVNANQNVNRNTNVNANRNVNVNRTST